MSHKWLRGYVDGVWTKPERKIKVDGEWHDLDEYAKKVGVHLPDTYEQEHGMLKKSKKQVNTDIKEKHADMEQPLDSGHTEVDGDGDSESSE